MDFTPRYGARAFRPPPPSELEMTRPLLTLGSALFHPSLVECVKCSSCLCQWECQRRRRGRRDLLHNDDLVGGGGEDVAAAAAARERREDEEILTV